MFILIMLWNETFTIHLQNVNNGKADSRVVDRLIIFNFWQAGERLLLKDAIHLLPLWTQFDLDLNKR